MKVISVIRALKYTGGMTIVNILVEQLVSHPVRVVNEEATSVLMEVLHFCTPSNEDIQKITASVKMMKNRFVN